MTTTAPQIHTMSINETRSVSVSFDGKLDIGETMVGTPAIVEVDTAALTLDGKAVSSKQLTINGSSVEAGRALQFSAQAAAPGSYTINLICSTDGLQVIEGELLLLVC